MELRKMDNLSGEIQLVVAQAYPRLLEITADDAELKPGTDEWSKLQILGHLIDSALNNHQRCVRGAYDAAEQFPPYDQVRWVEIQGYQQRNWIDLVEMWVLSNRHLCQVLGGLTATQLNNLCNIGKESPVTLGFVMADYLRHLKMHLGQITQIFD
jgi:hypothetical protein